MRIEVLDHGYVKLIEPWGGGSGEAPPREDGAAMCYFTPDYERGIIEAARQSTQGSFRGWDQDAKLLKYLYDNKHATPFEFAGMIIEVQAPIFVFREWHRHRTQSYNEMSARYEPLPDLYYMPDAKNIVDRGLKATVNKQAAGTAEFRPDLAGLWAAKVQALYAEAEALYRAGLSVGIPKELARITMPVGHYSRMRASANLRNWLAFMTLRCDENAQWEIRQYANAVAEIIKEKFPRTARLWVDERTGAGRWP